jgi:hypothetical protein
MQVRPAFDQAVRLPFAERHDVLQEAVRQLRRANRGRSRLLPRSSARSSMMDQHHFHCENGCEKAQFMQVFFGDGGVMVCVGCWLQKIYARMIECTPEVCE